MILTVQKKATAVVLTSTKLMVDQNFDSNHKPNVFNQNSCPLLYMPQKTNFNPIIEIKSHTIQHNNQADSRHTNLCFSPTLETKNPESLRTSTYYSVSEFIDKLIEGKETIISSDNCNKYDALTFLKVEQEPRNLPPIELYKFSGDPSKWLEFKISANMFISKPPFQTTNEWRDSSTFQTGKQKG